MLFPVDDVCDKVVDEGQCNLEKDDAAISGNCKITKFLIYKVSAARFLNDNIFINRMDG